MLKLFCVKFQEWGYIEFNKLDQDIREILKKEFIAKKIYMSTSNDHINQRLVNLIINKQLLIWDKNNFHQYKKMYVMSKVWLFESNFAVPQPSKKYGGY